MSTNPNLAIVRRKAAELGATIIGVREGIKHTLVTLQTRAGQRIQMALSRSKIDNYVMGGWTRQAVSRASRNLIDATIAKRANDNEILR